eukprot:11409271-Heterocapsa_arctica.AAC.1
MYSMWWCWKLGLICWTLDVGIVDVGVDLLVDEGLCWRCALATLDAAHEALAHEKPVEQAMQ